MTTRGAAPYKAAIKYNLPAQKSPEGLKPVGVFNVRECPQCVGKRMFTCNNAAYTHALTNAQRTLPNVNLIVGLPGDIFINMTKPKAYIFDLDGTLLESMDVWSKIDDAFFKKRNITRPDDYTQAILPMHIDETAVYTINRFGLNETPEAIKQEWLDMAIKAYSTEVNLKPHAKEYLESLNKKGHKLAIATSLPPEIMIPALHKHGIYHIFQAICTASEVGCGKTKPDIFLLAAKKLGTAPEDCLLFDDLLAAAKSAKSIGMKVCAVYDKTSAKDWKEIQQLADYAITSFQELLP